MASSLAPAWAVLASLANCHVVLAGEYYWPQQKGNMNRTGHSPYVVTSRLDVEPTWVWKDPHLDVIRSTPLIDDQKNIYLSTQAGRLYKFSSDGAVMWTYRSTRGNLPTVSSIMDGVLYCNSEYGFVMALDMETGKELWATQISLFTSPDTACVFALHGTIVSSTATPGSRNNDLIVALNTDGTLRWTYKLEHPTFNFQGSSPGDGTLVFQDKAGGVYRLLLETGRLLWESGIRPRSHDWFTTGATVCGPNGMVYAASNAGPAGIIHAYWLKDGAQVWVRPVGMQANQGVAYGKIAGSDRPAVVAGIGTNPGVPVMHAVRFMPQFVRNMIHSLSIWSAGRPTWFWGTEELPAALAALDAETGDVRWFYKPPPFTRPSCEGDEAGLFKRLETQAKFPEFGISDICLPDNWAQAVIGGDGTVYAGHQDGKLYAVRDANGNGQIEGDEVSTYYFGHAFQASQGIAPGMLAVVPCGGGLYVWKNKEQ